MNQRAQNIVNSLLEALPGVTEDTLDEIMDIILQTVDSVKSGDPSADVPAFENEVNPKLKRYGVSFSSHDPDLNRYGAMGRAALDGVILKTPHSINRREFSSIRTVLSHELVHSDQMSRAMLTGNAAEMYTSSRRRILKHGQMDWNEYQKNPHEATAHARTAIDGMRHRHMTRNDALDALRNGTAGASHYSNEKARKRFNKAAVGYAQDLPDY